MTDTTTLTEIVLPGLVEPDGLVVQHRPIPAPARGEALVQMLAAGVSFGEQSMRRGLYPGQPKFPFVLGYDIVGTVTAVGADVDPTLLGRRVAAVIKTGGWSTHAVIAARTLVPIPDDVDPAAVETALQGKPANAATIAEAARLASSGAKPLPMTGYKLDLLTGLVKDLLEKLAS